MSSAFFLKFEFVLCIYIQNNSASCYLCFFLDAMYSCSILLTRVFFITLSTCLGVEIAGGWY